ncbi:FlhC family transcriptional regulator [Burkholderia sp. Bp8986]|uniref:FlhC family transcriptional regulator n=1 Tax=Burkholderia sp. Bp8986 TaxID=2184550 RepID=UPI000F5A715C|nr:FlhC family transcriptional regulator [Burkholderia sp. Bp8986]RQS52756.1 flagellar transcriptional regulator FlhC [Burkholderia sp. Bp8986]
MNRNVERPKLADDAKLVMDAVVLIRLGARLPMLQSEVALAHDRLARLHREVTGTFATKGMLPFSTDWYMTWMANLHASLFFGIYRFLRKEAGCRRLDALAKAYDEYTACCEMVRSGPVLTVTRAWMLVRFVDGAVLGTVRCVECGARFIAYCHDVRRQPRCVGCHLPARAGKRRPACAIDLRVGRMMPRKNPPHPGKRSG